MMIDASLNEVEGLAGKAARGAGLAWGMAEETAKAARWLAAGGLDWAPSLALLLANHARLAIPVPRPSAPLGLAEAGAMLSPLATGAYLDDLGAMAGDLTLPAMAHPLWLLPFAAHIAAEIEAAVVLDWTGVTVTVWPFGGDVAGDPASLYVPRTDRVSWTHLQPGATALAPALSLIRANRSAVAQAEWQALADLGARTYVPASAISRAKGAGAGSAVDND
jgi:hypothetical protein